MQTTMIICMGSSCFARGNGDNLEQIERFLTAQGESAAISLAGCRCRGECGHGPNLEINGVLYQHVDAGTLDDLLAHAFPNTKQGGTTDEHS